MVILGLDFDNTLITYDKIFFEKALEMDLVDFGQWPKDKDEIRNHLRSIGKEKDFTKLQGEVYGPEIVNAEAAVGVLEALKKIENEGK